MHEVQELTNRTWPHSECDPPRLHIARQNYLVNGHAGVLASRPDFRKLLDHEQVTPASAAAHASPGPQPIETTVWALGLDDQEEWAHVDH